MRLLSLLVIVASVATASADEFKGWSFTAPSGYTRGDAADRVDFTKIVHPTFCKLGLYVARPLTQSLDEETKLEWKNTLSTFTTSNGKRQPARTTKSKLEVRPTTFVAKDSAGTSYAAIHYLLVTKTHVSTLLVMSTNEDSMAKCNVTATTFLDSLALDGAPTAPEPTPPALAIAGRWANSAGGAPRSAAEPDFGLIRREYRFAADGTYRFHSELKTSGQKWILTTETGAWKLSGDQLALEPKSNQIVVRDDKGVHKRTKGTIEKMTYRVQKHFFEGIGEWNLVLTPTARTIRDGDFAANESFPKSYLYSDTFKPEWRYAP